MYMAAIYIIVTEVLFFLGVAVTLATSLIKLHQNVHSGMDTCIPVHKHGMYGSWMHAYI